MGPLGAFLYGSLISVIPLLGQAAISDTAEERNSYLKQAAFAMALEVAGRISTVVLQKIISKAATLYAKIKLPKKVFATQDNIFSDLSHYGINRNLTSSIAVKTAEIAVATTEY
ncbi:hypothetical protein [Arsenophonus sp. PmNCSU2021_1]|uniref:hypothetical protein n=1 Tax=Arsenophonus sp. PmNCSU2021_1 TaxID=3118989 RepID=UPI002FF2417D